MISRRSMIGLGYVVLVAGFLAFLSFACASAKELLMVEVQYPSDIMVRHFVNGNSQTDKPPVRISISRDAETVVQLVVPYSYYSTKLKFDGKQLAQIEGKYKGKVNLQITCSLRATDASKDVYPQLKGKVVPVKFLLTGDGDREPLAFGTIEAAILDGAVTKDITLYTYTDAGGPKEVEVVRAVLTNVTAMK